MGGAKPSNIINTKGYNNKPFVKIATSNLYIEPDKVDPFYLTNLSFAEIGSSELINSVSNNLILNSNYSNYSNISEMINSYSSYSILPMSDSLNNILTNKYSINLNDYVPFFGKAKDSAVVDYFTNPNGYNGMTVYVDDYVSESIGSGTLSSPTGAAAPYTGTITSMYPSTSGLSVGDVLYLTSSSTQAFVAYARIDSVSSTSVTISSVTTFSAGSVDIKRLPNPKNIVIDVINIEDNLMVEVEFFTTVNAIDDTM